MPLPTVDEIPWAIAVPKGEADFARLIGDIVGDWHREGKLIAVVEQWGVRPSDFLTRMRIIWTEKAGDTFVCRRFKNGDLPEKCR